TRRSTVPDYDKLPASASSIVLASALEERAAGMVMTPHLTDNVSNLTDGFFAFFEVYTKRTGGAVDAVAELYDGTKQVFKTKRQSIALTADRTQQYIRVQLPANIAQGTYTFRILGLDENTGKNYTESDYLFRSERPIVIERTVGGATVSDLDKAIRQLRYIATQTDIDTISAPATPDERRVKFDSYWKSQDPTPNTARNEAFEEYYARIDYANKNFRSYNDGWLTDMGMVYVILGQPAQIDRRNNNFDGRGMVTWFYQNTNRRFLFVDNTGFGDFRLSPSTPFNFNEKYRYGM
ncbi:MAG: GWxTD domain-containing protein, partial [Candidatus Kapabacteria bacterium]|nr:GWxTD domain-containing protein [Candidatus Kapabacteria bacterium]